MNIVYGATPQRRHLENLLMIYQHHVRCVCVLRDEKQLSLYGDSFFPPWMLMGLLPSAPLEMSREEHLEIGGELHSTDTMCSEYLGHFQIWEPFTYIGALKQEELTNTESHNI
ncbi:hypothetical protein ACJX0J_040973 [Zea mays]